MRNASIKLGEQLFPIFEAFADFLESIAGAVEKNPWLAWVAAGVVALGTLTAAFALGSNAILRMNVMLTTLAGRSIIASRAMRALGTATKGVLIIGLAFAALQLLGGDDEDELAGKSPAEQLKILQERLKKSEARSRRIRTGFGKLLPGQQPTPGVEVGGVARLIGGKTRTLRLKEARLKEKNQAKLREQIKEIRKLVEVEEASDPTKVLAKLTRDQAILSATAELAVSGPQIEAPKGNRIVRVDELNINLQVAEGVNITNLVDLLATIFERELLNAEAIAP